MNNANVVRASVRDDTESADWRPFNVWAAQVRSAQQTSSKVTKNTSEAPRDSWDPYAVWKRQVRGS